MEAKDLKIGNYIIDCYCDANLVESIHKSGTVIFKDDTTCSIEKCKPIELTEELLLKCGFEKTENIGALDEYYYRGKCISLTLDFELSSSNWNYESTPVDGAMQLKYIHQLQNLHFALTGQELEINL